MITIDYLRCDEKCPYIYGHCINVVIRTMGNTIGHCTVMQPLLQNVLPKLAKFLYETYLQKKTSNVYMLQELRIHRKFTLNEDNAILHIGWRRGKKYQTLAGNEKYLMCLYNISSTSRWMFIRLDYLGLHAHKIVRSKNGKHGSKPHISHGPSYFLLGKYTRCKRKWMRRHLFFVYQIVWCKDGCVLLYGTLWELACGLFEI